MDKIAQIKAEIERLKEWQPIATSSLNRLEIFINSLPEEPVSEDFEEALAKEWQSYIDRGSATVDALEDNTQELAFAKGFYWGAQWQKKRLISKACEWLEEHDTRNYEVLDDFSRIYVVDNQKMIGDFRKALEK